MKLFLSGIVLENLENLRDSYSERARTELAHQKAEGRIRSA